MSIHAHLLQPTPDPQNARRELSGLLSGRQTSPTAPVSAPRPSILSLVLRLMLRRGGRMRLNTSLQVGDRIEKIFNDGLAYYGTLILTQDEGRFPYVVVYDDGDMETYTANQVKSLKATGRQLSSATVARRYSTFLAKTSRATMKRTAGMTTKTSTTGTGKRPPTPSSSRRTPPKVRRVNVTPSPAGDDVAFQDVF